MAKLKTVTSDSAKLIIEQANENFRCFFNTIKDMLFVLDVEGRIIHTNATVTSRLGYTEEEITGKSVLMVHPEDSREEAQKIVSDMLAGNTDVCHIPAITKSGVQIPVETRIVLGNWNGRPALFGVVKDVSELKTSEEKFSRAFHLNSNLMAISRIDDDRFIEVNDTWLKTLGFEKDEVIGKTSSDLKLFVNFNQKAAVIREFEQKGSALSLEASVVGKDGVIHVGLFSIDTILVGTTPCWITTMTDITERNKTEESLRESEERYFTIFEQSPIAIEFYDADGCLLNANKACLELFGIESINEVKGFKLFDDPNINAVVKAKLLKHEGIRYESEFNFDDVKRLNLYKTTCSGIKIIDCTINPILNDNTVTGYIVQVQDITDRKNGEKEILHLSNHDQLTGLYNRRYFDNEMKRLDTIDHFPLSIIMVDVNGLKLTNDAFGHKAGDELLKKAASILVKKCRNEDIVSRIGGDEFLILLPGTDASYAGKVITRINKAIDKDKGKDINPKLILSLSMGSAVKRTLSQNNDELFKEAEDNMYRNKLADSLSIRRQTIDLIMNTLYEKNNREMLHSKRVSELCETIALKMDLDENTVSQLHVAGLMHDIGKIGIDESIINSPTKLDSDEWAEIKRHPEIGYRILSSVNEFSKIADFVLEHHERFDGKGYPRGIKGEEISLQARIIAISDSFDAMTSKRTYKEPQSEDDAIAEIKRMSGKNLDPKITRFFIENVLGKAWD